MEAETSDRDSAGAPRLQIRPPPRPTELEASMGPEG